MRLDPHDALSPDAQDRIVSYLVGGMSPRDSGRFEAHLATCEPCREELGHLEAIVGDLALTALAHEPPRGLRERVLALTSRQPASAPSAILLSRDVRKWIPSGVPGVEISQLWADHERERHTTLIRLAAGASLPMHRHAGPEECLVLEGDLRDGALRLAGGDYVRHEAGSQHELQTLGGCLLLVTASFHDERLSTR